jgi:hypothetical protein
VIRETGGPQPGRPLRMSDQARGLSCGVWESSDPRLDEDERITWAFAAGSILVLIGVYVGALRRSSDERVPEAVGVPSER